MDPDACLERIIEALELHNNDEATEAIEDLQGWMDKSGHMPRIKPHQLDFILGKLSDLLEKRR